MPQLALATGTVRRSRGDLPQLPLVNMFVEQAVTEPTQFALQSRPGLNRTGTQYGAGPIHALYKQDRVVNGAVVAISDSDMYAGGVTVGSVLGNRPASIAGNEIGVIATKGGVCSFWDGTTYRSVSFPDGLDVVKVFEQGGRFLFIPADSQTVYWTAVLANMLDGSGNIVIDPLDYASAESEPDRLLDAVVLEGGLVLAGLGTIEFWNVTGDSNLPYVPTIGRAFHKGVKATGCITLFDNTFAWVSPDNIVYRPGNVPERISDSGIEELIAASATVSCSAFYFEGYEMLKVDLDFVSLVYGAHSREWCEWTTYGHSGFVGGPSIEGPLFGSKIDGNMLNLHGDTDLDGELERRFRAGFPLDGGTVTIANVGVRTNPGQTAYLTGVFADPVVEMRLSRDGGQTWGIWRRAQLGAQGEYRKSVVWRSCGLADAPGILFEFRVTDPVPWRVSGAYINEPRGGRSR